MSFPSMSELIEREDAAYEAVKRLSKEIAEAAAPIAHQGDGNCGAVLEIVFSALKDQGIYQDEASTKKNIYTKERIKPSLRTAVFERDAYRCVQCGDYHDLQADHIHPESKGGEMTLDNLQTLCKKCNVKKGAR
jgi:hypothetical protein